MFGEFEGVADEGSRVVEDFACAVDAFVAGEMLEEADAFLCMRVGIDEVAEFRVALQDVVGLEGLPFDGAGVKDVVVDDPVGQAKMWAGERGIVSEEGDGSVAFVPPGYDGFGGVEEAWAGEVSVFIAEDGVDEEVGLCHVVDDGDVEPFVQEVLEQVVMGIEALPEVGEGDAFDEVCFHRYDCSSGWPDHGLRPGCGVFRVARMNAGDCRRGSSWGAFWR